MDKLPEIWADAQGKLYRRSSSGLVPLQAGTDAAIYATSSSGTLVRDSGGFYVPASVTFSAFAQINGEPAEPYAGRFIISGSTDGFTFTPLYTSAADETSKVYNLGGNYVAFKIALYRSGGTSTLLDSFVIGVAAIPQAAADAVAALTAAAIAKARVFNTLALMLAATGQYDQEVVKCLQDGFFYLWSSSLASWTAVDNLVPDPASVLGLWQCKEIPAIPDNPSGVVYKNKQNWASGLEGWIGNRSTLSIVGGILTVTATAASSDFYKTFTFAANKHIRLYARSANGTVTTISVRKGTTVQKVFNLSGTNWTLLDFASLPVFSGDNLSLIANNTVTSGVVLEFATIYVGNATYSTPNVDGSGLGGHGTMIGLSPQPSGLEFQGVDENIEHTNLASVQTITDEFVLFIKLAQSSSAGNKVPIRLGGGYNIDGVYLASDTDSSTYRLRFSSAGAHEDVATVTLTTTLTPIVISYKQSTRAWRLWAGGTYQSGVLSNPIVMPTPYLIVGAYRTSGTLYSFPGKIASYALFGPLTDASIRGLLCGLLPSDSYRLTRWQIEQAASDGKITPMEKTTQKMNWDMINGDGTTVGSNDTGSTGSYWTNRLEAIALNVATTTIDAKRNALCLYLFSTPAVLSAVNWLMDIPITASTYTALWSEYYAAEAALFNSNAQARATSVAGQLPRSRGSLASDPSTDNREGDYYYNTTSFKIRAYKSGAWSDVSGAFTAAGVGARDVSWQPNWGTDVLAKPGFRGNLTGNPASPKIGDWYFNTTNGKQYEYDGATWNSTNVPTATQVGARADSWQPNWSADVLAKPGFKGNLASPPSSPKVGDWYFNTGDGKQYEYDGATWVGTLVPTASQVGARASSWQPNWTADVLSKPGFKGNLSTPPGSPVVGDWYFNTTDGKQYEYNGSSWSGTLVPTASQVGARDGSWQPNWSADVLAKPGFKGNLSSNPVSGVVGDWYFNTSDGKQYEYSGTAWVGTAVPTATQVGADAAGTAAGLVPRSRGNLSADPSSGNRTGDYYYNTLSAKIRYYDGAIWSDLTPDPILSMTQINQRLATLSMVETWSDGLTASLARWADYSGSGEASIVDDGEAALEIGNNVGNDQRWFIGKTTIAFDPSKLYRVTCSVKRVVGSGTIYLGIAGRDATDTHFVATDGTDSYFSQHYFAATAAAPTLGVKTKYVGYFRGAGGSLGGVHNDPTLPGTVHANVRGIRPLIIVNYSGQAGTTRVYQFKIEEVYDAELAVLIPKYRDKLTADPTTGSVIGDFYFNTSTKKLREYTSVGWADMTGGTARYQDCMMRALSDILSVEITSADPGYTFIQNLVARNVFADFIGARALSLVSALSGARVEILKDGAIGLHVVDDAATEVLRAYVGSSGNFGPGDVVIGALTGPGDTTNKGLMWDKSTGQLIIRGDIIAGQEGTLTEGYNYITPPGICLVLVRTWTSGVGWSTTSIGLGFATIQSHIQSGTLYTVMTITDLNACGRFSVVHLTGGSYDTYQLQYQVPTGSVGRVIFIPFG